MTSHNLVKEFKEQAIYWLKINTPKIERCLEELTEEEVWEKPNNASNSVGNLILHLCGNIRQYIISSLGKKEDVRERDKEFSARGGYNKRELLRILAATIDEAAEVIARMDEKSLLAIRAVQGVDHSGTGNIIHVIEHYSYHAGQIIFWTKLLRNKDLDFYGGRDLNKKNKV